MYFLNVLVFKNAKVILKKKKPSKIIKYEK